MSAINSLRTAVNDVQTTQAAGATAFESAFAELAADIAAIPDNKDVQAEADRVAAFATNLGEANTAFAQRLRDAIPTDAPAEPLPPATEPMPEEGGSPATESPATGEITPADGVPPTGEDGV